MTSTERVRIRDEAAVRGWAIDIDDGHRFRATGFGRTLSVWFSRDGRVLMADLLSDDATIDLVTDDVNRFVTVLAWLNDPAVQK